MADDSSTDSSYTPDLDAARIARYLSGAANPLEARAFEEWVAGDPARQRVLDDLRLAWSVSHQPPRQRDLEGAWRRVLTSISGADVVRTRGRRVAGLTGTPPRGAAGGGQWFWRAPAFVAATLVTAVAVVISWGLSSIHTPQAVRELATPAGGRATAVLRDGSRVVLGPATRVHVPGDFGQAGRAVELDGEAVFTVVHNARHPFTVVTSRTRIQDVGTTFAVRAYRSDTRERVAVAEGQVTVGAAALRAHDIASVDSTGRIEVRRGVDVTPDLAWAQGQLVFRATPLREVARELGRTFGLDVSVADSALNARRVTATFTDQPVDAILNEVADIVGGHCERAGNAVVIRRRAAGVERVTPDRHAALTTASAARHHE